MKLNVAYTLLKDTFSEWSNDKASRLAAALAYYTVISLPPLMIIIIAVAGAVFGEEAARGQVVTQLQGLIGKDGAEAIEAVITSASGSGKSAGIVASLISLGVLIFGATAVVIQLQDALNTIWEVAPKPGNFLRSFIFNRLLSFGMILGIAFMLLVSLVMSAALAVVSNYLGELAPGMKILGSLIDFAVSTGVVTILFALMFKYLPDAKIAWRDVMIGAFLTALLFNLGKYLIGLYLGKSAFGSTYGAAGSLVVLLAWIYYSAQILFLGAEFTQVYARSHGSHTQPLEFAEPVTEEARAQQGIKPKK
ncbi:MAG: YihY/virulence factor BrkB family protein [Chitinophagaceae bacterium]|nr:MAG: YihY/virulence factor BrkB family protein [Chitinophagaceae bacterium]